MKSHNSLKVIYQLVLTNDNFILYGQTNIQIALNMKRVTSDELISIIPRVKTFRFLSRKNGNWCTVPPCSPSGVHRR